MRSFRLPSSTLVMSYLRSGIEKSATLGKAKSAAFHLTQIEIESAAFVVTFIIALCAVLTLYVHKRQRHAVRVSAHQFEQARAARVARVELSACRQSVADADSALERLQELRVDNLVSARRQLRLSRSSFPNDDHLYRSHQSLLRAFDGACLAAHDHIAALHRVVPLAAVHSPAAFKPDVIGALVDAESSFDRVLHDSKILLEEAEQLLASIKTDFENLPGPPDRPARP